MRCSSRLFLFRIFLLHCIQAGCPFLAGTSVTKHEPQGLGLGLSPHQTVPKHGMHDPAHSTDVWGPNWEAKAHAHRCARSQTFSDMKHWMCPYTCSSTIMIRNLWINAWGPQSPLCPGPPTSLSQPSLKPSVLPNLKHFCFYFIFFPIFFFLIHTISMLGKQLSKTSGSKFRKNAFYQESPPSSLQIYPFESWLPEIFLIVS